MVNEYMGCSEVVRKVAVEGTQHVLEEVTDGLSNPWAIESIVMPLDQIIDYNRKQLPSPPYERGHKLHP